MSFTVTEAAMRPASSERSCFYCHRPIGESHADDCVLVIKRVVVRAVIEYEVSVPASWDAEQIEFHRNDGSWCANNMIGELEALSERDGCVCSAVGFEWLRDAPDSVTLEET